MKSSTLATYSELAEARAHIEKKKAEQSAWLQQQLARTTVVSPPIQSHQQELNFQLKENTLVVLQQLYTLQEKTSRQAEQLETMAIDNTANLISCKRSDSPDTNSLLQVVKDMQAQQKQMLAEINLLRQQVKSQKDLEQTVENLSNHQLLLMKEYQSKQEMLEQQRYLESDPKLCAFYQHFQRKLIACVLASKVISSGQVKMKEDRLGEHIDKAKNIAERVDEMSNSSVVQLLSIPLDIILPGVGLAVRFLSKSVGLGANSIRTGLAHAQENREQIRERKLQRVSNMVIGIRAIEDLAEGLARLLAFSYEHQIKLLTTSATTRKKSANELPRGGAESLAEYAVARVLEAFITRTEPMPKIDVHNILASNCLNELIYNYSEPSLLAFAMKELAAETDDENLFKEWTLPGLLDRAGIQTIDGKRYRGNSKQGYCDQPELYGYRYDTSENIQRLQLNDVDAAFVEAKATGYGQFFKKASVASSQLALLEQETCKERKLR